MNIPPSSLRFTQDSIAANFTSGDNINQEIEKIKSLWSWQRESAVSEFEPLEIDQDRYDGRWYCNDNRRLYMFRVLEKQGYVSTVRVSNAENYRILGLILFKAAYKNFALLRAKFVVNVLI